MENSCFGIIIKVANIDMCRSFYRDALKLGDPVIDSNFFVEFKLTGSSTLILEKSKDTPKPSDSIVWCCRMANIERMIPHLERNSCFLKKRVQQHSTIYYYFSDPENNAFCLTAPAPPE